FALCIALTVFALLAAPAGAKEFALFNNSWAGTWKTQTAIGAGFRGHHPTGGKLGGPGAGTIGANATGEFPGAHGAVGVNDDAELNWPEAWDNYSAPMTGVGDLSLVHVKTRPGIFLRT